MVHSAEVPGSSADEVEQRPGLPAPERLQGDDFESVPLPCQLQKLLVLLRELAEVLRGPGQSVLLDRRLQREGAHIVTVAL
jgi:hypothetical protein